MEGFCVFNGREHRVSRDASVRKRDDFGFLDWNIIFIMGAIIQMKPIKWSDNIFVKYRVSKKTCNNYERANKR